MANYNPHAPHILGQEWVPIRQADYPPDDNLTERGYTFRLEHAVVPVTGAYYVASVPANRVSQVCEFISVYPAGREINTGPIKKVNIPVSAVATTGPSVVLNDGAVALQSPTDDRYITFTAPGNSDRLQVNFNTEAYSQQLFGKRILDVTIRYVMIGDPPNGTNMQLMVHQIDNATEIVTYSVSLEIASLYGGNLVKPRYGRTTLTDLNPFWDTNVAVNSQRNILPWRFQELNLFRSGAPVNDRLAVVIQNNVVDTSAFLTFMDMEVTYCEENRVRYGGRRTANINAVSGLYALDDYSIGQNIVRLYDTNFANTASLAIGDYTVTVKHVNINVFSALTGEPTIRAVRPYYNISSVVPVRIKTSLTENDTFSLEDELVVTDLTLHTASTIVTGVHAYGTSYGAPVYGSITATQEIEDDPVGSTSRSYPQVRFYARRFGYTTVPLKLADVATGVHTVSITPDEFDALDEIVDGWREVTLRFLTPPSFTTAAGDVDYRWSATGELAGNQWQILVADGPSTAVTTPASLANALATGKATYYAPQGDTVALTWKSPAISGTAEDSASDAVLIFSEDPPAVSGLAISVEEQALEVVDVECAPAHCIPTGIGYLALAWTPFGLCDNFDRDESATWGTSTSGTTYTGSGAMVLSVEDDAGLMTANAVNVSSSVTADLNLTNVEATGEFQLSVVPTGATIEAGIRLRAVDGSNFVDMRMFLQTSDAVTMAIRQVVGGVETSSGFPTVSGVTTRSRLRWRVQVNGSTLRAKVWNALLNYEPPTWNLTLTTTHLTAGDVVFTMSVPGGVTNTPPIIGRWSSISVQSMNILDGRIEVQRRDEVDTTWRTVVDSPACVSTFNDYEARVGVLSEYRIRTLNALDFAGAWVTGSGTLPAPGVGIDGDANSVLIFTSNADPTANLAYVMQWENSAPTEEFAFPEAGDVIFQEFYGRDYVVAFHPLERGGEQFTRTILVSAAALTPSRLANFHDLRDLAWADLDYVCVRDELGNRWFAAITVPSGEVRQNRTIYLAKITVRQVTDTPSPYDPTVNGVSTEVGH